MCLAFLHYINDKSEAKKLPKLMNAVFLSSKYPTASVFLNEATQYVRLSEHREFGEKSFFHPYPTIVF